VNRAIGVAAERDSVWRRILVQTVDDDGRHFDRVAGRQTRRVSDHRVDHSGWRALVRFDLCAKLRSAEAKIRAGALLLDDRDTDLERRDFLAD